MRFVTTMTATWTAVEGRARWNGEPLVYWVDMLVAELVEEFAPIEVWLFGSVARGDDDADGGLDMLVVLDHYDAADAVAWKRRGGD